MFRFWASTCDYDRVQGMSLCQSHTNLSGQCCHPGSCEPKLVLSIMSGSMALPQPGSMAPVTTKGCVWATTWDGVAVLEPSFCWTHAYLKGLGCHPGLWWHFGDILMSMPGLAFLLQLESMLMSVSRVIPGAHVLSHVLNHVSMRAMVSWLQHSPTVR